MGLKSFFSELKRRNIYKVAVTYGITGWIIIQIATSVFPALEFPEWTTQFVIILTLIGFPISMILTWAFEITAEGVRRTPDVDKAKSIARQTGKKLNYWIIGALAAALLFVGIQQFWFPFASSTQKSVTTASETASVAVLPFNDYSPDKDQEWFCDGFTEELLNSLARLPELKVASRTSSFLFRDSKLPVSQIADSLNVNHIVEGSVRRAGNQLRVTAQLIQADNGKHLWSKTYNAHADSVFRVQQNLAEEIATALNVYMSQQKRERMFAFGTRDVKAYEQYLKGRKLYREAHESMPRNDSLLWIANKHLKKAYTLDNQFSAAFYLHHDAYAHYLMNYQANRLDTLSRKQAYRRMQVDLDQAISNAGNQGQKLIYQFDNNFLSHDWSQLPVLFQQIYQSDKARSFFAVQGGSWVSTIAPSLGYAKFTRELVALVLKKDPSLNKNIPGYAVQLWMAGKQDSALIRSKSTPLLRSHILLAADQTKQAKKILSQHPESGYMPVLAQGLRVLSGIKQMTLKDIEAYAKEMHGRIMKGNLIFLYFAAGFQQQADQWAHRIDASFLGPQRLLYFILHMGSYIPFNLDAAPHLETQLQQAGVDIKTAEFAGRKVNKIVQKDL